MISPRFCTKCLITMVPLVTGAILPPMMNSCDGFKLKNLHNSEVIRNLELVLGLVLASFWVYFWLNLSNLDF